MRRKDSKLTTLQEIGNKSPKIGYRDDTLFGDEITNPIAVAMHEIFELQNQSIILNAFREHNDILNAKLNKHEIHELKTLTKGSHIPDETTTAQTIAVRHMIDAILDGRDFCKWLCEKPEDIWYAYVEPFDICEGLSKERYIHTFVETYVIPDNAVRLANNEEEGSLWAWNN